jgi:hypothetical protein
VEDTAPQMQPASESLACVDYNNDVKGNETEQDLLKSQPTPDTVAGIDCNKVNGNETKQEPPQLSSHPTPETTLACIDCDAMKGKEGFYKSQWKLREKGGGARCKSCWDIHRVSEQLSPSPKMKKRTHAVDVAVAVDVDVESPPETLVCIDCNGAKKKEGFYRNQWKLRDHQGGGGARCKPCWDNYLLDSSKKQQLTNNS